MQARNNVVALNQNSDLDLTLLGFTSIDIRTVNTGDVVIFRTASLGHSRELPLRHGRTCKVVGFNRNRQGDPQVTVRFKTAPELGDQDTSDGLTQPVDLSPVNLVAMTTESFGAAKEVHNRFVAPLVAQCAEAGRPWMARLRLQTVLGDLGMYDRLAERQPRQLAEALPY
jgi:hypothetical protein